MLGTVLNAAAEKYLVAWAETAPDCISFLIIVTEDNGEYIGSVSGTIGSGCPGGTYVEPEPDTPADILDHYPQIKNEMDDAYRDYLMERSN